MAGVTDTGFVVKRESECFDELIADCRATVDPEFDDSADSVTGQIAGIVASKQAELWEVLEAVWGSLSESATGAALDRIAALTNTRRRVNESDAALRIRRRLELSDQGATTEGAMRAALSRLTGMQAARVVSNRSMVTDAAGRPPKSVEAAALGTATGAQVAQTIWENLPAGIDTYGTTTTSVTDSEGHSQTVRYSTATAANWWVRISAEVDEASFAGPAVLRQRIQDFTSGELTLAMSDGSAIAGGIDIGGVLYRSRISAAALTVPGVTAVTQVQFRANDTDPWLDTDLPLGPRQSLGVGSVRGFATDHIEVATA